MMEKKTGVLIIGGGNIIAIGDVTAKGVCAVVNLMRDAVDKHNERGRPLSGEDNGE